MKKVFWQGSILLHIGLLIFLGLTAIGVYLIVSFFTHAPSDETYPDWAYLVVGIGTALYGIYTFVKLAKNRIILTETEIFVPGHWGSEDSRIQYETHIKYDEIKNIFMTASNKNSLGQDARWVITIMPYIVFECRDGGQEAINVLYFSKKQAIKIIDLAIERAKALGNDLNSPTGEQILAEFLKHEKESLKNKK